MVQVNNPVYSYESHLYMSSFPPEVEISYEYDGEGYPVKAHRQNKTYRNTVTHRYIYAEKN